VKAQQTAPTPPVAARRPRLLAAHGDTRVDPYYWLREKDNPEVIAYLEAENAYSDAVTAPTLPLQEKLYREIVGRVQESDASAPTLYRGWWSYTRTVEGLDYEIYCRRRGSMESTEEVVLDGNVLAEGHEYFDLGYVERSPDETLVAYAVDVDGSERHELHFRDLATGKDLADAVSDVYYGYAWSADSRTFFYVLRDAAMRPYQVWRHSLGTPAADDVLVMQEDDERFELSVEVTKSERYIVLTSSSQITSESSILDSADPSGKPRLVEARRQGIEYSVEHQGDRLLILTNDGARNFRLMTTPAGSPGRTSWTELVPERAGVRLNAIDVHAGHAVLGERSEGLQRLEVVDAGNGELHVVDQPDSAYTAFSGANPDYESRVMRFFYTSLTAPWSAVDYDMETRHRTVVKEQPVGGGYDRGDYTTERQWATAPDGVRVPISLVYRRDLRGDLRGDSRRDGSRPALLYGYGAYEVSSEPMFDSARLSLLDRGYVFAIAHVRGGGEMGREWYEDGKFLHKTNTFTDFIACAERLVELGYTSPERLAIRGRSAGGLLVGAVLNLRPDLFACAVAQVPFVDALTTMLDDKLPLTVGEFEEWGNPAELAFYEYMKSYSPYDNVRAAEYPALLVTTGLNDPSVSYWEPAKWVAKLRSMKRGDRTLLLQTEMRSGHSGPSGRYESWREEAFITAFVLEEVAS
jgi:oligopeptidase B